LTGQNSFRAARDVAAGKSVGGEDDPAMAVDPSAGSGRVARWPCGSSPTLSQPASERITLRWSLSSNR